jgi:hypothetical protein
MPGIKCKDTAFSAIVQLKWNRRKCIRLSMVLGDGKVGAMAHLRNG